MKLVTPKWLKVVWILCIPIAVAFLLYILSLMIFGDDYLPERGLSETFVRTHPANQEFFGKVL